MPAPLVQFLRQFINLRVKKFLINADFYFKVDLVCYQFKLLFNQPAGLAADCATAQYVKLNTDYILIHAFTSFQVNAKSPAIFFAGDFYRFSFLMLLCVLVRRFQFGRSETIGVIIKFPNSVF
jgi:hypothetical protein